MLRDRLNVPRVLACAGAVAAIAACGGGGGGGGGGAPGIYPLWVATDVAVVDVDGDGRADVLTASGLLQSEDRREGRISVYRQTSPGTYAAPETYTVGAYAWRITVADIDGNGAPDLLVVDAGDTRVNAPQPRTAAWMLLQDRAQRGRFGAPTRVATGPNLYAAAVADLDGDGVPDLVTVGDHSGLGIGAAVQIQDRQHRGTFAAPRLLVVPGTPTGVAAADFDGDGRADLALWVVTAQSQGTPTAALAFMYQKADGTFGPPAVMPAYAGLNVQRLVPTDANGDGLRDIVAFLRPASAEYKARLVTAIQQPKGVFTGIDTPLAGIDGIDDAAVADLDGGGRPDAAVAGWWFDQGNASRARGRVTFLAETGGGAFSPRGQQDVGLTIGAIAAGDLDGDGRNDLVVYGGQDDCRALYQSRASPGTFEAARPLR